MQKKFIASLLTLAAITAWLTGKAAAEKVKINGKYLSSIDDIVLETTGSRTVKKSSLLKVIKNHSDNQFYFYTIYGDGTGDNVPLKQDSGKKIDRSAGKTNTGIHPVLGKKRKGDKLLVMLPRSDNNELGLKFIFLNPNADNHTVGWENWWTPTVDSANTQYKNKLYISDAVSGIFPNGRDGSEFFAVSYFVPKNGNDRPGLKDRQEYNAYIAIIDTYSRENRWTVHSLGITNGFFPEVKIVAGDFDHDGKEDELAVLRDGREENYYLQVFKVKSDRSISSIYNASFGQRDWENIDGCDITAGNFDNDKDGKQEIALVYSSKEQTHNGQPTVVILSWNGSSFTQKSKYDTDSSVRTGESTDGTNPSTNDERFGIIAEAADVDGNGTDEIVFLTQSYGANEGYINVHIWKTDGNLNPSKICHTKTSVRTGGYGGVYALFDASQLNHSEASYLGRSISLAVVPVGDRLSTGAQTCRIFITKSQGGDSMTDGRGYSAGDKIYYCMPKFDENGVVTGLDNVVNMGFNGGAGYMMAAIPCDAFAETVELGEPTHAVFYDEISYAAEMQAVPYHIDYIKPDFPLNANQTPPENRVILNASYMGSTVAYSRGEGDSKKKDVAFNSTSTLDVGINADATARYKKLVGIKLEGGFKDTSTKVETSTNTAENRTTFTLTDTSKGTDWLVYYKSDRHVWRYPVLSYTDPNNTDMPSDADTGELFMTFSVFDTPGYVHGGASPSTEYDDYQPSHQEDNLFSYPTAIGNIPYYEDKQADLTPEQTTTVGQSTESTSQMSLLISDLTTDVSGLTTKSKKEVNGSLTLSLGTPKTPFNANLKGSIGYSNELTNTETFARSYSLSEQMTVTIYNSLLGFIGQYVTHTVYSQMYSDVAGVMKVAFAVDLQNGDARMWRSSGMYGEKPDPALVLPAKFGRTSKLEYGTGRPIWDANYDRRSAIQLRGISFWDNDEGKYAAAALEKGRTYTISIPVYNASFKAPDGDVEIEMRLREVGDHEEKDDSDFGLLDTQAFSIGAWQKGTENNKTRVSFNWTVPENLTSDNYDLYFVIDPKNLIDEIHENWDYTNDPGGNNTGRYPVAVLDKTIEGAMMNTSVRASEVTEDDFRIMFRPVRADDKRTELTLDEFREEIKNIDNDEPFRAYARTIYSGSEILTNYYLNASRIDPDDSEHRLAYKIIPAIFPNSERNVSFMVYPENVRNGFFQVDLIGDNGNFHWSKGSSDTPDTPDSPGTGTPGSPSGGCDAGFSLSAMALSVMFAVRRKNFSQRRVKL